MKTIQIRPLEEGRKRDRADRRRRRFSGKGTGPFRSFESAQNSPDFRLLPLPKNARRQRKERPPGSTPRAKCRSDKPPASSTGRRTRALRGRADTFPVRRKTSTKNGRGRGERNLPCVRRTSMSGRWRRRPSAILSCWRGTSALRLSYENDAPVPLCGANPAWSTPWADTSPVRREPSLTM